MQGKRFLKCPVELVAGFVVLQDNKKIEIKVKNT